MTTKIPPNSWINQQCRAFIGWMNAIFRNANCRERVVDLETDLSSGVLLARLLEILTGEKVLVYAQPLFKLQSISNLVQCIQLIQRSLGSRELVNISAEDIYDGRLSLILGCIWNVILTFGFNQPANNVSLRTPQPSALSLPPSPLTPTSSSSSSSSPSTPPAPSLSQIKRELMEWVNHRTLAWGVQVADFRSSWSSGRAICALVSSLSADFRSQGYCEDPPNPLQNWHQALNFVSGTFDIAKIVHAEEMASSEADERSLMAYLSLIYHKCKDYPILVPISQPKVKKIPSPTAIQLSFTDTPPPLPIESPAEPPLHIDSEALKSHTPPFVADSPTKQIDSPIELIDSSDSPVHLIDPFFTADLPSPSIIFPKDPESVLLDTIPSPTKPSKSTTTATPSRSRISKSSRIKIAQTMAKSQKKTKSTPSKKPTTLVDRRGLLWTSPLPNFRFIRVHLAVSELATLLQKPPGFSKTLKFSESTLIADLRVEFIKKLTQGLDIFTKRRVSEVLRSGYIVTEIDFDGQSNEISPHDTVSSVLKRAQAACFEKFNSDSNDLSLSKSLYEFPCMFIFFSSSSSIFSLCLFYINNLNIFFYTS